MRGSTTEATFWDRAFHGPKKEPRRRRQTKTKKLPKKLPPLKPSKFDLVAEAESLLATPTSTLHLWEPICSVAPSRSVIDVMGSAAGARAVEERLVIEHVLEVLLWSDGGDA